MLTPEELRALVMATLHAPQTSQDSHWTHNWDADRRAKYIAELRRDADLIIAAAGAAPTSPPADSPYSFDFMIDERIGVAVLGPFQPHEIDGVGKCLRCGRELWRDGSFATPCHPAAPAERPRFETDADGDRGVMVSPPAHRHRLDQPAAPAD